MDDSHPTLTDPRFDEALDGSLDAAARARLDADLAADPSLAEAFEAHRRAVELVRALPHLDAAGDVYAAIRPRLRRRAAVRPRASTLGLDAVLGVLVVLLVALGVGLGPGAGDVPLDPCSEPALRAVLEPAGVALAQEGDVLVLRAPATAGDVAGLLEGRRCRVRGREPGAEGATIYRLEVGVPRVRP